MSHTAPPPLILSIPDAASVTGLTHWQLRHAINTGELTAIRLGRRIFVPVIELGAAFGLTVADIQAAAARLHDAEREADAARGAAA